MELMINRFPNQLAKVIYFMTEPDLRIALAVVGETENEVNYYHVCIAPFFDKFSNSTVYQIALNPVGDNYESGLPSIASKERIQSGLLLGKIDVTKSQEDVYFLLTGKRRKAIVTNVIG